MPTAKDTAICPECEGEFPFRSNKRFCSSKCRKAHAQKKDREANPINAANSWAEKREQKEDFDLAMRMAEALYTLPPTDRFGYIEEVIQRARSGKSGRLRRILTNPDLIWPNPAKQYLFFRRAPRSYCTISQAADRYCRHSPWRAGVQEVVRGDAPEPETGQVLEPRTMAA